ncbi:cupin domain-containing protein [Microbacterium sp. 22242]|uniref:cupin domain-containing protein n=1 Tax=Microbacterium sp. 22242 TaxID=3453896 RepID=UPI003F83CE61
MTERPAQAQGAAGVPGADAVAGPFRVPRRIVTGHDGSGASVVVSDAPVPVSRELPEDGVAFHEVWVTHASPAAIGAGPEDPTAGSLTVPPPARGTRIRINEFLPGHLDARRLQSPVHRTESIDYGVVLDGEITLVLDDGEVTARAGDVIVQRGTDHAWANRGDTVARVAFVLVGGAFGDDVLAVLPSEVREGLMTHGPRDAA